MLLIPKLFVRNRKVASPSPKHGVPDDPLAAVAQWAQAGIEMIHIVDLDVPVSGPLLNADLITQCIQTHHLRVHVSGNFKTIDPILKCIAMGVESVILGSIAYQKPEYLKDAVQKAPGKIGVAIDVKNGKVSIPGWAVTSHKTAEDYYDQFAKAGISCCYYSDVVESSGAAQTHLDGVRSFAVYASRLQPFPRPPTYGGSPDSVTEHATLPVDYGGSRRPPTRQSRVGPPLNAAVRLVNIYYNGEIMSVDDMAALLLVEKFGVQGCVISKALYEQRLDLASSVTYLRERSHDTLAEPTIMED